MIAYDDLLFALDATENVVVMTDLNGHVTYANKAFEKIYGYTREEVYGKRISILKSGYHDDEFYRNLWEVIENGETWEGVFNNKTKDGRLIWEQARISPIIKDGMPTGYIAVKDNITYKKELEEQIAIEQFLLQEFFSNSPVGIVICQPVMSNDVTTDATVIKANHRASEILMKMGIVGLTLKGLFPSTEMNAERLHVMSTEKLNFETYLVDVGKYLSFRTFPLYNNLFCVVFIDVTNYKTTIRALTESEARYTSLVEDSPVLICRFNKQGVLVYANNLMGKMLGVNPNKLIGFEFYSLFDDHSRSIVKNAVESLSSKNTQVAFEQQVVLGNQVKWQRWVVRALCDKKGRFCEIQAVGMDFTEMKQTQMALVENRNKLETVVNNNIIGIGIVNSKLNYELVNNRFCNMMGYTKEELICMKPTDITFNESHDLTQIMLDKVFNEEIDSYTIEKQFIRKDGTKFWANLFVSALKSPNGHIKEVVGLIADINEKKQAEMQIVENERKLKELNDTKDKLFSIIAHDIKNPFHTILGLASILNDRLNEFSTKDIEMFVGKILEEGENTYKLLEDLLTWGRSQLGKLKVSPQFIAPSAIVNEVFQTYKIMAGNKNIQLLNNIKDSTKLWGDSEMIKFALRNLIHNGLKFTPVNGIVTCFELHNDNPGRITLAVKDSGIGIRPEKLSVLFDINAFLSTFGTAEEKGTGLGLSLTHEMITLNQGVITVESEPGKGTTFFIELPMYP